jgi:voltage-gated potassium channel
MANREERARRAAEKHESRQLRVEGWVDKKINRKGLRPRYAAYLVISTWLIAIVVFGIVQRAADPDTYPNIWLAWWWAIQTVTTVGYGDVVPQSTAGKAVASILMVGGLSFLSILTATITSSFVARRQDRARARGEDPVMQELARLSGKLESLETELKRSRGDGGSGGGDREVEFVRGEGTVGDEEPDQDPGGH